jgi:hypothetical protein
LVILLGGRCFNRLLRISSAEVPRKDAYPTCKADRIPNEDDGAMVSACYLCGLPLIEDRSSDHLPPKQFFAHGECKKSFERDEEYFTWSVVPLAIGSTAGNANQRADVRSMPRKQIEVEN